MCGDVQEVHWRHADEELASEETEAENVAEAAPDVNGMAANISDQPASIAAEQQTWQHSGVAPESAAYTAYPGYSYYHAGAGNQSATPWSDWASVEGSAAPRDVASTQADLRGTEGYAAEASAAAHGVAASGEWSPAELAAQAKAWADWAAWQAQKTAQPSQDSSHVWPSGAVAHPSSAVGQPTLVDAASSTTAQPSPAELAGTSKKLAEWADWAGGPTQHAAPATDHNQAPQSAGAQQAAAQAHQTAQAGDAETVTVPVSLYKRYQALEWAEWYRQYESWQAQYSSWYACYEHWYSSYLAWYNVHGGSG